MTSSVIGAIRVNLGMNSAEFSKDVKTVNRKLDKFGRKLAGIGKAMAASFAVLGAAAGAAFAKISSDVDQLAKSSQQIGIPIEELSALRHAADLSGVSFEKLKTGVGQFSRAISDSLAGAKSEGVRALDSLNVSLKDGRGQLKSTTQILEEVADRFQKMPDGALKTATAMQIFGKAGRDMIPLLNQGSAGIAQMTKEASQLGLVIGGSTGAAAEKFNDNLTRMKSVLRGIANAVFSNVIPTMVELSERFLGAMKQGDGFKVVVSALTGAFNFMVNSLLIVINNLDTLKSLFKLLVAAQLLKWVRLVVAGFYALAVAIRTTGIAMAAFTVVKRMGLKGLMLVATVVAAATNNLGKLTDALDTIGGRIKDLFPEDTFAGLKKMFEPINSASALGEVNKLDEDSKGLSNTFLSLTESANKLGTALGKSGVAQKSTDAWKGLRRVGEVAKTAAKKISPVADTLKNSFSSWVDSAVDGTFKLKDALRDLSKQMAKMFLKKAFSSVLGSFGLPGFANGTNSAPGGLAMVGERGPEMVNLPKGSSVTPSGSVRSALRGGTGGVSTIRIVASSEFDAMVESTSANVSAQIVRAASPAIINQAVAQGQKNAADGGLDGVMSGRYSSAPKTAAR